MLRRYLGTTPIELIALAVVLAVFCAPLAPRLPDRDEQARAAAVSGLAGAMRSSAALAHSLWSAAGGMDDSVTIDGQTVTLLNGYPTTTSIIALLKTNPTLLGYRITDANAYTALGVSAANEMTCAVRYAPSSIDRHGEIVPAQIDVVVSNCN